MFENPKRGRQAKKFTTIVFRTDIFRKLSLGAPDIGAAAVSLKSEQFSQKVPRPKGSQSILSEFSFQPKLELLQNVQLKSNNSVRSSARDLVW